MSNLSPDLVLACIHDPDSQYFGENIAVECKYRNNRNNFFLEPEQIKNYEEYIVQRKPQIKVLYYLFGFGWNNNAPEEVYLIPSTALYEYDRETGEIKFLYSPNKTRMEGKFKDYQVVLDRTKGKKYIQYKLKQS